MTETSRNPETSTPFSRWRRAIVARVGSIARATAEYFTGPTQESAPEWSSVLRARLAATREILNASRTQAGDFARLVGAANALQSRKGRHSDKPEMSSVVNQRDITHGGTIASLRTVWTPNPELFGHKDSPFDHNQIITGLQVARVTDIPVRSGAGDSTDFVLIHLSTAGRASGIPTHTRILLNTDAEGHQTSSGTSSVEGGTDNAISLDPTDRQLGMLYAIARGVASIE